MASKKFDFVQYLTDKLNGMGARKGVMRQFALDTQAGVLEISVYDDNCYPWVACVFDDVMRAKEIVRTGCLNRCSGKWNWHGSDEKDVKAFADLVLNRIAALV